MDISGKLKEYLMLALFAVIIITVGAALGPTVEAASYGLYVAASNTGLNCSVAGACSNYTAHGVVALIAWLLPTGYYLAIVLGVFLVLLRAIKT